MKSSKFYAVTFLTAALAAFTDAHAAGIDMKDPRRAVGLEDDIRIDAQVLQEAVSTSSPLGVRYQIQNLSRNTVAVADRVTESSYDLDTQTITLSIGCEVPASGLMPHLVLVMPGETKTLTAGALVRVTVPSGQSRFAVHPRLVQVKVNVLRDVAPFSQLIRPDSARSTPQTISDALFEKWMESSDAIFLNAVPVQWAAPTGRTAADRIDASSGAGMGTFE
jgi:hypothetical protein